MITLRWDRFNATAQRYLHLDTQYFVKGGVWAFLQQLIGVSSGLAVSYLFGHFVSKQVFGQYNLVLSILGMLTFLSLPGIDLALPKAISLGHDTSFFTAMKLKFRLAMFGIPVVVGFAIYYFLHQEYAIGQALVIAACVFPLINTFTSYPAFLTVKKKFGLLALLSSMSSLFFLFAIAVAIFLAPTPTGIIFMYLLALIVPAAVATVYCRKLVRKASSDTELPAYGSFLTILSVLPWISGNLGIIILERLLGVEALAVYSVAGRFFTAVQKNFQVFYKPATAKLAYQSPNQHLTTLKEHGVKLILIGCVLSASLWIATPYLISFFFTQSYQDAISYGRLFSLGLIPLPLSWVLADIMIYQKHKMPQIFMSTLPQLIKILLYFILIPTFKIRGLILVMLIERFSEPLIPLTVLLFAARKNR